MAQAVGCVSKVYLTITCTNLINRDLASKSDPLCVVHLQTKTKNWKEVGRTEQIQNNLNPKFSSKIEIDYFFEETQNLRFGIYDIDNSSSSLDDDDFLGEVECTLGQIVSNKNFKKGLLYKDKKHVGKSEILISAEEITDNRYVTLKMKGTHLDKKDFLGKSDPFLELMCPNQDGSWKLIHRTEYIKNNLNPQWKPFSIPIQTITGDNNIENKIRFVCYDWDSDGSHDLIGEFTTTLTDLEAKNVEIDFINPKKKSKKSYKNSGFLTVQKYSVEKKFSFLDYILGGLQINFTVGIDFTGSNGKPTSKDSLHYIDHQHPNEYLRALYGVGGVLQDYDTDKLFPAFGFGAKILSTNEISHEFPLNFQPSNPYCVGIEGIAQAYKQSISQVLLWGPTNISPIINHVARFAFSAQQADSVPRSYFILLIITDGVITDIDQTREAIVNASNLPMSIIIVGVGQADFSAMEMLDGDNGVLRSPTGQAAARDIVQFVPYHEFKKSDSALARAVLAEVPSQVVTYFKRRDIVPGC